jgi:hypothetical protein
LNWRGICRPYIAVTKKQGPGWRLGVIFGSNIEWNVGFDRDKGLRLYLVGSVALETNDGLLSNT